MDLGLRRIFQQVITNAEKIITAKWEFSRYGNVHKLACRHQPLELALKAAVSETG